jgi:hypothetical protein
VVASFSEQPLATIATMATVASADRNACSTFDFIDFINAFISAPLV